MPEHRVQTFLYDADGNRTDDEALAVRAETVELLSEGNVVARHAHESLNWEFILARWKATPKALEAAQRRTCRRRYCECGRTFRGRGGANQDGEGDPCRRVLLGNAGPDPEATGRSVHEGGVHGRRRPERDVPQPRDTRRGDRDRVRSRGDVLPGMGSSSSSRSTIRRRLTVRATTSARATARRSSTSTMSSGGSQRTPSQTSRHRASGRARS